MKIMSKFYICDKLLTFYHFSKTTLPFSNSLVFLFARKHFLGIRIWKYLNGSSWIYLNYKPNVWAKHRKRNFNLIAIKSVTIYTQICAFLTVNIGITYSSLYGSKHLFDEKLIYIYLTKIIQTWCQPTIDSPSDRQFNYFYHLKTNSNTYFEGLGRPSNSSSAISRN